MASLPWIKDFEAFGNQVAEAGEVPGVSLGLAINGETVYEGYFGYRDVEKKLVPTPNTVFGLGSVSKTHTALAVSLLADAGALDFSDPVVNHLPEMDLPPPKFRKDITVHHLLTHTSGLPNEWAIFYARAPSMRRDPDIARILTMQLPGDFFSEQSPKRDISSPTDLMKSMAASNYDLIASPGRHYSYSNEGYALLQGIVERVSGKRQVDFLREKVWDRLGMTSTDSQQGALARDLEMTTLYARFKEGVLASPAWQDISEIVGNGGLASSVSDLLRELELFRNNGTVDGMEIISSATLEKMMTPYIDTMGGGLYGYGMQIVPGYHGVTLMGHGGGNKGVAAHVGLVPEKGITVAGLANLTGAPTQRLTWGLVNGALGLPFDTAPRTLHDHKLTPAQLAEYEGTYSRGSRGTRFFLEEGGLCMEGGNGRTVTLKPVGEDVFVRGNAGAMIFVRDEAEKLRGVFYENRLLTRES